MTEYLIHRGPTCRLATDIRDPKQYHFQEDDIRMILDADRSVRAQLEQDPSLASRLTKQQLSAERLTHLSTLFQAMMSIPEIELPKRIKVPDK